MPQTPKWFIPYPTTTDTPDVPRDIKALAESVDDVAKFTTGTFANRGDAATARAGRYYLAIDVGTLYLSDGVNWMQVAPAAGIPIGGMIDYGGTSDPSDTRFVVADGRVLAKATYPALFTVIAARYASSHPEGTNFYNSATHFRIPDVRGRMTVSADDAQIRLGGTFGSDVGASGGTTSHSHIVAIPQHNHSLTIPAHTHASGSLSTSYPNEPSFSATGSTPNYATYADHTHSMVGSTASGGGGMWTTATNPSGSTTTAQTTSAMPPYVVVNKLIRVL